MQQHRDVAIDQVKRRGSWTNKLRKIAEYAVETASVEQFSSARSAKYSKLMKERAINVILPSLFDVSQSYEDFVFQHNLWQYTKPNDFPRGKAITWQCVPRPPKLQGPRKRPRMPRSASRHQHQRETESVDAFQEGSGDDTEVDEGMTRYSEQQLARQAKAEARRQAKSAQEDRRSQNHRIESTTEPRPSEPISTKSTPTAPAAKPTQRGMASSGLISTPSSSFGQSMHRLNLQDDVKGRHPAPSDHYEEQVVQDDVKPITSLPQQHDTHSNHPSSSRAAHATAFSASEQPPFPPFAGQDSWDFSQMAVFNEPVSLHSTVEPHSMNNEHFPYNSNALYTTSPLAMTAMSNNPFMAFNGLPYHFETMSNVRNNNHAYLSWHDTISGNQ